jgi:hypothetical protein
MSMQENGFPEGSSSSEHGSSGNPPEAESTPSTSAPLPRWATKAGGNKPMLDSRFAAFVGPRWESSYRKKFARFVQDPAFVPTWNWAAALFAPVWFLYRKLYLAFAAFYLLPGIALSYMVTLPETLPAHYLETPEARSVAVVALAVQLSMMIAAGGTANWLLFRRARAATVVVALQQLPEDAALSLLQRIGGVNWIPTVLMLAITGVFMLANASLLKG